MINSNLPKVAPSVKTKKSLHLYPMWQTDYAPALTEPKVVEVLTDAGAMDLLIDPTVAPHSATYMYTMLTNGSADGCRFWFHEKNYILSVSGAMDKMPQFHDKLAKTLPWMRCLPLEPSAANAHQLYALTLAHDAEATDNGFGAFSILLTKAPQLDKHFCCFGRMIPNAKSKKTLAAIEADFKDGKHWIISAKEI